MKTQIFAICTLILLSLSCKKQDLPEMSNNKSPFVNNPNANYSLQHFETEEAQLAYAKKQLGLIAKAFSGLTESNAFKNILATAATNTGDSVGADSCVLIERLITVCTNGGYDLVDSAQAVLDDNGIDENFLDLVYSLRNIDGENYFIQIYIPQPETEPVSSTIYAVPYWEDEEYNNYTAYKKKYTGLPADLTIDSITSQDTTSLMGKHVWVFSVNDIIENDGTFPIDGSLSGDVFDSTYADSGSMKYHHPIYAPKYKTNAPGDQFWIQNMAISIDYDGWMGGPSEVYCIRKLCNESWAIHDLWANTNNERGDKVGKFTRQEIHQANCCNYRGYDVNFNWVGKDNWYAWGRPIIAFVLYERDALRKKERNSPKYLFISPTTNKYVKFEFRSANVPYALYFFTNRDTPYPYNLFNLMNWSGSAWQAEHIEFNNTLRTP
jgi:hypothetical protein